MPTQYWTPPADAGLDSQEAENSFLAAAGLSGPPQQLKNFQKQEFKSTSQPEFLRALAQQRSDVKDKTGLGWNGVNSSQSEDITSGWSHNPTPAPQRAGKPIPQPSRAPVNTVHHPSQPNRAQLNATQQSKQPAVSKLQSIEKSFLREGVKNPKPNKLRSRKQDTDTTHRMEMTAPQVEMLAPNLKAMKAPRPNKNWEGSNPSLPSSVSSAPNGSPNAVDDGMAGIKDIRNEIGLENNFRVSGDGDKWLPIKFAGIGRGGFEPLGDYDYLDPFIVEWMQTVPEIKASFIEDETPDHWYRDVNPATGELIEPIVVPETLQSPEELEQELDWRRQNWTSSLMIRRRLQHLDHDRKQNRNHRVTVEQDCSATMANVGKAQSTAIEEAKPAEAPKPENIRRPPTPSKPADDGFTYCRWVPRMPCFLRPAEGVDMEAVAQIYNMEMKNGLQVWDSEPLNAGDWEKILAKSQELGMPFIVVVRGNVINLGLNLQEKSGNFILSSFQRVPKDVKDPKGQSRGEILGFGFFSPWQLGLAGSASGVGRAAARMHIYVHPDYRRKSIGFSLMDMLMYCTSSRHISQDCFDFVDPDNDPVYWKPLRRAEQGKGKGRIFMSIYIGYFVKTKLVPHKDPQLEIAQKDYDKDLPWVHKLLYDKLHWEEKGRFEAAYRTAKCHEGPPHWLDELLYEHQCQWDPRFHECADKY